MFDVYCGGKLPQDHDIEALNVGTCDNEHATGLKEPGALLHVVAWAEEVLEHFEACDHVYVTLIERDLLDRFFDNVDPAAAAALGKARVRFDSDHLLKDANPAHFLAERPESGADFQKRACGHAVAAANLGDTSCTWAENLFSPC